MNFLLTVSLFAVLFGLSCASGIPAPIKFEETNLKPGTDSANATVRMHHIAMYGTVLSFKAKAAPSDVTFTIVIKVAGYDCLNVNDGKICMDHLKCSYGFERTLAASDDGEIIWRTQTMDDYGEMVWQNPPANITYCGHNVDNYLANTSFNYNGDKELNIHIYKISVVSVNFFANHNQKDIEHFSLSYTLGVATGQGYLSLTDDFSLFIFWMLMGMFIFFALVWITVLVITCKNIFKIHLWILLVLFLVVLEKAMFAGLYTAVNQTGINIEGHPLYIIAELVSSARNLLTRLLLVASFGYGTTVKPNLNSQMNRVVSIGIIYGVLSFLDGMTRAYGFCDNAKYFTTILLVIVDTVILYWVITSNRDTRPTPKVQPYDYYKPIYYNRMIYQVAFLMLIDITYRLWPIIYTSLSLCLPWWSDYLYKIVSLYPCLIILHIMHLWKPSRDPETLFFNPVMYGEDNFKESKQEKIDDTKICKIDSDLERSLTEETDVKLPKENLHSRSAIDILLKFL